MAQLIIALRRDPATGKQNIIVKLDRESDSLPIEHEQLHRSLIEKLLGQGIRAEDLGTLVIEREGTASAEAATPQAAPAKTASPRAS